MKRVASIAVVLVILCSALDAFVFTGSRWPDGTVVMQLQLGTSGALIDGSASWGESAEAALATWNTVINREQFRVVRDSSAPTGRANGYNNVFFSSSMYGQSFDSSTLAVTLSRYVVSSGQTTESDVLFNTAFSWNSYSGPLRRASAGGTLYDFRRVALHEFGHVLGLDHPDQAGQSVASIMNSRVSDTDRLQADDVAGATAIYGGRGGTALVAPGAPSGLAAAATGSTISLSWRAPSTGGSPSGYVIEAGSASGLANLASFSTGSTATSFSSGGVGAGAYYVRVRAANAAGRSGASNESLLVVGGGGGCSSAPGAPSGFTTSSSGSTVTLRWNAAGGNPTTYVVEAGSAPGLSNLANSDLGSPATSYVASGVGRGTYYVRMRGRNPCGLGPASNEALAIVQ